MHGFFVEQKVYEKARLLHNPFTYAEHRERAIQDRISKQRASRVKSKAALPKVNRGLAKKLMASGNRNDAVRDDSSDEENADHNDNAAPIDSDDDDRPRPKPAAEIIDPRFRAIFESEDFAIDEDSTEYKLLHPVRSRNAHKSRK